MSIIIYQNEQVFYYKDLGEIIFFSFGQAFCRIIGQYFTGLHQIQHCMTQTLNVR